MKDRWKRRVNKYFRNSALSIAVERWKKDGGKGTRKRVLLTRSKMKEKGGKDATRTSKCPQFTTTRLPAATNKTLFRRKGLNESVPRGDSRATKGVEHLINRNSTGGRFKQYSKGASPHVALWLLLAAPSFFPPYSPVFLFPLSLTHPFPSLLSSVPQRTS